MMGKLESMSRRSYRGPDRRRHRVFVTKNTEYHCRDGICVAVRDRATGAFIPDSHALGRHISASVRFNTNGGIASAHDPNDPHVGEQLCFSSGELDDAHNILTSPLARVERPSKEVVAHYTH
jgi:hypothetical protein